MRKKSTQLTLRDVAKILDVSTATISNAFNRPSQLSDELRKHILNECENLNYFGPNAAARSLRTGKTGIVGVMLSNYLSYSFSDPVAQQFLQGLAEVFEKKEYNLLIVPSREDLKHIQGSVSFVDGFIVYGPPNILKLEELKKQNKFVITVDFDTQEYVSVNIDNYEAAKKVADHAFKNFTGTAAILALRLKENNRMHRLTPEDIIFDTYNITSERLRGYLDSAKKNKITILPERIINVNDNTYELGFLAAKEILSLSPRPKLLLCMSDRLAIAAIEAARGLNLRVPDDLLITGFDDIYQSSINFPSVTTIHQQSTDKGRIAAEIFLGLREEKSVLLTTDLVVRQSCP